MGNQLNSKETAKDMQNYLISHVLFDGKENVYTSQHIDRGKRSNLKLAMVNEDCSFEENDRSNDAEENHKVNVENECEKEDRMFEAYKQEMEKYLSCFEENKEVKKKKKSKDKIRKASCTESEIQKRPVLNLGTIRDQFEGNNTAEDSKEKMTRKSKPKKIGKLQGVANMFEEQIKETTPSTHPKKRKDDDYVPDN